MESKKKADLEICAVPRWQLIKASLQNLDYEAFLKRADEDENAVMVDVRTEEEHQTINIPGSIVLDYLDKELADKIEELDKSKNYYVYCRTGRRSLRVCVILRNLGFEHIYNLDGGIVSAPQT